MKELFLLDPEVVYLNHGSFGACPRPVFEAYQRFQRELERQPVEFLALERRLPGVYNAGFENLSVLEIAQRIAERVGAEIRILPSNDPRSYRVCSYRLLAAGFAPRRSVAVAVDEMVAAFRSGALKDDPASHNVTWMKQHNLG